MAFNSPEYLLLLALTAFAFFGAGPGARLVILVLASLAFYAAWSLPFVSLIILSAIVDFSAGHYLGHEMRPRRRRLALFASLAVNLGLLGYFKYANFFIANVMSVLSTTEGDVRYVEVLLPAGISFYTFQTMSYTIDVYRGRLAPTRSFLRFMLYVTFFPQLIAGPIERAGHLLVQFDLAARRAFRSENLWSGLQMIAWGMFKKVVLADHCAAIVDQAFASPADSDGWSLLVGTYAFTLQIYCDFSAYSEIARGSARIFGIDLMRNFDQPYLVTNIRDFWRRWHISLSQWFRDYVYQPLGGSRRGPNRLLVNLAATMFLSGLWHGAAWNFVLWGLFHGALLLLHAAVARLLPPAGRRIAETAAARLLAWLFTFHLVAVGWVLFRVGEVADFPIIVGSIASSIASGVAATPTQQGFIALTFLFVGASWVERRWRVLERIYASAALSVPFVATLVVLTLLLAPSASPQFIYFQF